MKVLFVFLLVLVFGFVSSHGWTNVYRTDAVETKHYDEFFLVQQWPASFCRLNQCRSIPTYFTVHGLWAQLKSTGQAVTCDKKTFKISKLKRNTQSDLKEYWPDLKGKNEGFWRHEYNTHASCILPFQNDQDKFFSLTLNLAKKYNVTTMLLKAGIPPGTNYSVSKIRNAISSAIKFTPTLECNKTNDGTVLLFQIYLCFDETASKLQNCTKTYKRCPTQKKISFPDVPPPRCPSQSLPGLLSRTGK